MTALANSIQAMITGDNLDIKCWPYDLYHDIWIFNSFPELNATTSMVDKATYKWGNLSSLWTFGCRFCVRPPDNIKPKLKNHVSKGISLGYYLYNNRNVLYCDIDTHIIKLASHVWFDEGINYLPISDNPLNFQHLNRVYNLKPLPE